MRENKQILKTQFNLILKLRFRFLFVSVDVEKRLPKGFDDISLPAAPTENSSSDVESSICFCQDRIIVVVWLNHRSAPNSISSRIVINFFSAFTMTEHFNTQANMAANELICRSINPSGSEGEERKSREGN